MKISTVILSCVILLSLSPFASAQQSDSITDTGQPLNLVELLPPLPVLIDSALAYAPRVREADATVARSEYSVQEAREDWTKLISVTGRYTYGQFLFSDAVGFGLNESTGGYQAFAGVTIPLNYLVSRKERLGVLTSDLEVQKERKREALLSVREQVITTYNQLLLLQRLINISAEARESAILQYQMAEERFREGEITLEELGRSTEMRAKYASEYERLRSELAVTYAKLERLVGTAFRKFSSTDLP